MNIKDIHVLAIIVRLFALYLLVNTLISSSELLISLSQQGWMGISLNYLFYPVMSLLLALFLLFFPMTVAKGILPYRNEKSVDIDVTLAQHLFPVAIVVLGMYFLFDALVNMFYWMFLWVTYSSSSSVELMVTVEQKGGTIATVAELLLSLILIFRAKKITKLIKF
jgi:hypothetical protein